MTEEVKKNANQETISIAEVKKAIGDSNGVYTYVNLGVGDAAIKIMIKKQISLMDIAAFVEGVMEMVFRTNEQDIEIYCPQFKDFAFRYNLIVFFTNIDLQDRHLQDAEQIVLNEEIYEAISDIIGPSMYILYDATDDLIQYKLKRMVRQSKFDETLNSIVEVIKALTDKINNEDQSELLKYLEDNIPGFKDELNKTFQEEMEQLNEK